MTVWKNCVLKSVTKSTNDKFEMPCEVSIEAGSIVISYKDDAGPAVYRGQELEPGHFTLACPERAGRATANLINGERLEGFAHDEEGPGTFTIDLE